MNLNTVHRHNSLSENFSNAFPPHKIDDFLTKTNDKSFLKSLEIKKFSTLLKELQKSDDPWNQSKNMYETDATFPREVISDTDFPDKTNVITRSHSLKGQRFELYWLLRLARKSSLSTKAFNSADDDASTIDTEYHNSIAQLSHTYNQDQIVKILSKRLKV